MKKYLLFLFIYTLLFTSCFQQNTPAFDGTTCEEDCIIFFGKVWDPNNDRPVDAIVTITYSSVSWLSFSNRTIGRFKPKDDGTFSFRFDGADFKHGTGTFEVKAEKEGYLSNDFDGKISFSNIDSTSFDFPTITDIFLLPKAQLSVNFQTSIPEQIANFRCTYQYSQTKHSPYIPRRKLPADTTMVFNVAGDQEVQLSYKYTVDGQLKEEDLYLDIDAGTTEELTILLE